MRLCRLPCGKPQAFRDGRDSFRGYAARGEASPFKKRTESRRLSALEGGKAATDWAKPHPMIANA